MGNLLCMRLFLYFRWRTSPLMLDIADDGLIGIHSRYTIPGMAHGE
jgi:hypothetical protein